MKLIYATLLLLASLSAHSQTPSYLSKYETKAKSSVMLCGLEAQANILGLSENQGKPINHVECVAKSKSELSPLFSDAIRKISNKRSKEALKSYHSVLLAQLDAIVIKSEDTKSSYSARQNTMESRANELWNRLVIELM